MFADICGVEAAFWRRMESNIFPWKKHCFLPEEALFYMKRSGDFPKLWLSPLDSFYKDLCVYLVDLPYLWHVIISVHGMRRILLGMMALLFASALWAQNWDIDALQKVNGWDNKFVRNYNKVISQTEPYVAIGVPVAMAVASWIKHDKELLKDALYVGTSVAGAFVVTYGMKYLVDRERPYDRWPDRVHAYSRENSPSFPSGHTATAFALATSLCVRYPKWYVIAPSALWACSVGVSRMNEGVHYPSDVLAGAAIGAGCAVVNVYVNRWLNRWLFGER